MISVSFQQAIFNWSLSYFQEHFEHQWIKRMHFSHLSSSSPKKWYPSIFSVWGQSNIPALFYSSLKFEKDIQKSLKHCPFLSSVFAKCFIRPSLMEKSLMEKKNVSPWNKLLVYNYLFLQNLKTFLCYETRLSHKRKKHGTHIYAFWWLCKKWIILGSTKWPTDEHQSLLGITVLTFL